MNKLQLTLFDLMEIDKNNELKIDKISLNQTLLELKDFIKRDIIKPSDTYFNIATHREPKVKKEGNKYLLMFAQSSDSERLLSAYESNNSITPRELLGVGMGNGAVNTIQRHIDRFPNDCVVDIFDRYRIWEYPKYNWIHAESTSMKELKEAKDIVLRWVNIRNELELSLEEGKYSFMRINKRSKTEDQTKVIPQCFDGMCLERNFMRLISEKNMPN